MRVTRGNKLRVIAQTDVKGGSVINSKNLYELIKANNDFIDNIEINSFELDSAIQIQKVLNKVNNEVERLGRNKYLARDTGSDLTVSNEMTVPMWSTPL